MARKSCDNCGRQLNPDDKFCPDCGEKIGIGPPSMKANRRDHFIVLGLLAAVAVVYIGYRLLAPPPATPERRSSPAAANRDLDAFLEKLPEDFESLVSMGNSLMDRGQYQLAAECYTRALEKRPGAVDVRVDLGTCQHSLNMNDKALANFQKALEDQPDHHVAKFNLGIVYYTLGEEDVAVEWWQKLLDENPPEDLQDRTRELIDQVQGS